MTLYRSTFVDNNIIITKTNNKKYNKDIKENMKERNIKMSKKETI